MVPYVHIESLSIPGRLTIESLDISLGESVAVIGPNGAGKTTLFDAITGLIPTKGCVFVEGCAVESYTSLQRAQRVSYLQQSVHPTFDFDVHTFLSFGFYARDRTKSEQKLSREEKALVMLRELRKQGGEALLGRTIGALSAGEFQRVRMARMGVGEVPLWLLDEPTANLDPKYQVQLLRRLREHCEGVPPHQQGGVVAIVHDLNLVKQGFERVIMLRKGEVFADGATSEWLTPEALSQLYETEMERADGFRAAF